MENRMNGKTVEEEYNSISTADGDRAPIGRWIPMNDAAAEMGISRSNIERKIKKGQAEAVKQGHNVYVLVYGPEPISDRDLLEDARRELAESEHTIAELRGTEASLRWTLGQRDKTLEDSVRRETILTTERNQSRSDFRNLQEKHRSLRKAVVESSTLTIVSLLFVLIATGLSG